MFINPRVAIEKGWIKGITDEAKQVQPNAIDFTLDEVWTINNARCAISESHKQMRGGYKIVPVPQIEDGHGPFWQLDYGVYDCLSNMYVELPEGVAAQLVIRSTFARNGMFLTSGLYDSGFKGRIGFALHIPNPKPANSSDWNTTIVAGTRVGQIIFIKASNSGVYSGGYNHAAGTLAPHMEQK